MGIKYESLPVAGKVTVAATNDSKQYWCGLNPNTYNIKVHTKGIFEEVFFGNMTRAINSPENPWLKKFSNFKNKIPLGDGKRHSELGIILAEEYIPIDRPDVPIGPKSGHHLNIITETDKEAVKLHIRTSWDHFRFAEFYSNYESFKELIEMLEGNLTAGLEIIYVLTAKAPLISNPSRVVIDESIFASIFEQYFPDPNPEETLPERSELATKFNNFARNLITKFYLKGQKLWPNIVWYNPYHFSASGKFEESEKDAIFEPVKPEQKAKRRMQKLYTNAHEEDDGDDGVTKHIDNLTRTESLIALYYAIKFHGNKMCSRASSRYCLGNDAALEIYQTKAATERIRKEGLIVDGVDPAGPATYPNSSTSASFNKGFKVKGNREKTVILMNPEDYYELEEGVSRTGNDNRSISLATIGFKYVYPLEGIDPGCARIIDERALQQEPYFDLSDLQAPAEELLWRSKKHFHYAHYMFQNFPGFFLQCTPHFIPSALFYEDHGLIGQEIEKKK